MDEFTLLRFIQDALSTRFLPASSDPTKVKLVIDVYDIVMGVYPDATEPHGYGFHLIKGAETLASRAKGTLSPKVDPTSTAIYCHDVAEAISLERTFGDKRPLLN